MQRSLRKIESEIAKLQQMDEVLMRPGVVLVPETCTPSCWPLVVLFEQVASGDLYAQLGQCRVCDYPVMQGMPCASCGVPRQQGYPRELVWPPHGGVVTVPLRFAERRFLIRTQQAWCMSRGSSENCKACHAPLAHEQRQCLICLDRQLYPDAEQRLLPE